MALNAFYKSQSKRKWCNIEPVSDWDKRAWEGTIWWGPSLNNIKLHILQNGIGKYTTHIIIYKI